MASAADASFALSRRHSGPDGLGQPVRRKQDARHVSPVLGRPPADLRALADPLVRAARLAQVRKNACGSRHIKILPLHMIKPADPIS